MIIGKSFGYGFLWNETLLFVVVYSFSKFLDLIVYAIEMFLDILGDMTSWLRDIFGEIMTKSLFLFYIVLGVPFYRFLFDEYLFILFKWYKFL